MADLYLVNFLILLAGFFSYQLKLLTGFAAFWGTVIALLLFYCFGYTGLCLMSAFFIFGNAVTSFSLWKSKRRKTVYREKRTASQVLANGGLAGIISITYLITHEQTMLLPLMIAAVFASTTSDTFSSELGIIYGKNSYNLLTFKKEWPGADGLVSLEGSLCGVIGAALIAVIFCAMNGWNSWFWWIFISGVGGNLADSVLGLLFQRKGIMSNDGVNFFNTVIAALILIFFWAVAGPG